MSDQRVTDRESFRKTGEKFIRRIKDSEQIGESRLHPSWKEIEREAGSFSAPKKRGALWIASVAASVALLLSAGAYYLYQNLHAEEEFGMALLEKKELSGSEDIILLSANKQLTLKDESSIQYDPDGKINVNGLPEKEIATEKQPENEVNELIVPKGKRASLTFSDGTVMYVNSDTRVIYPVAFKKKTREILVDGEIYLEVSKDASRPFIVKTKGFDVKVLGTRFNVRSYMKEPASSVVLVSGCVEVSNTGHTKTVLQPSQLLETDGEQVSVKEVDVFEYICWKDNMLSLDAISAGDILERLSRYYGRTIVYDDEVRKVLSISGKLELKETIEEAVEVICLSLSLQYTIDEENNIVVTLK